MSTVIHLPAASTSPLPVIGNAILHLPVPAVDRERIFQVLVEQSYEIIQKSWQACSCLAKRARFVMSHATGKIEIVGKTAHNAFMRYHQSIDPANIGKFLVFRSNPVA